LELYGLRMELGLLEQSMMGVSGGGIIVYLIYQRNYLKCFKK
jgi:hypothetical protein